MDGKEFMEWATITCSISTPNLNERIENASRLLKEKGFRSRSGRRNEQQFVYHIQYSPRTYATLFSLEEKLIPEIFPHGSRILTTDSSTKEFQPLLRAADYILWGTPDTFLFLEYDTVVSSEWAKHTGGNFTDLTFRTVGPENRLGGLDDSASGMHVVLKKEYQTVEHATRFAIDIQGCKLSDVILNHSVRMISESLRLPVLSDVSSKEKKNLCDYILLFHLDQARLQLLRKNGKDVIRAMQTFLKGREGKHLWFTSVDESFVACRMNRLAMEYRNNQSKTIEVEDEMHVLQRIMMRCLRIHFHGNLKIKEAKFSLFDVKTKGSDLAQVLSSEMVDIFQTQSNDVGDVYRMFGIRSVRDLIMRKHNFRFREPLQNLCLQLLPPDLLRIIMQYFDLILAIDIRSR
jgi:hypothetical protein